MAFMSSALGAIGNGAQAALGTSALSGAGSAAAGAGAGSSALAPGATSFMANSMGGMEAAPAAAGGGSGMFGNLMAGAGFGSANQAGGTLGTLLGQSLMNPSSVPQAPQGGSMADLFGGMAEKAGLSPKEWATPKFDTNSYINKLLSGVR